MIQVRMRKQYCVDAIRSKGKRCPVPFFLMSSLVKTKIHQYPCFSHFKKIVGSCYFSRRSENSQYHGVFALRAPPFQD